MTDRSHLHLVHAGAPALDRLVVLAGREVQRATERAAAAEGLGATAVRVLAAVVDRDPVAQRDLAGQVGVSPATLTPVMDRLEAMGALTRERDRTDRRLVRAAITPRGRELLRAASAAVAADVRDRMPDLGTEAAHAVREYLQAVVATFAEEDLPGPGARRAE
jgi:MarR family transcriptional regulator, organic hydroperoxide resistance regulator